VDTKALATLVFQLAREIKICLLTIRLPVEIENRLEVLAQATGRTKTFYARETILKHLDKQLPVLA